LLVAKQIHAYVKRQYRLVLNPEMLEYGSVKPDIHWQYAVISHNYDQGYARWLGEVQNILTEYKYRDINNFSQELGIILHFAADFFTLAHNHRELKQNMWKHLNYELKLHHVLVQGHFQPAGRGPGLAGEKLLPPMVDLLRQRYMTAAPGFESDISYIYAACVLVTDLLVEAVLLSSSQAA